MSWVRASVLLAVAAGVWFGAAAWLQAGPRAGPARPAPGAEHAPLAALAGDWTAVARFVAAPDQAPTEARGEMHARMRLGGRVLQQELTLEFGSTRLEGLGHWGYDPARGEYHSYWADTQGTQWIRAVGAWDAHRRRFDERGETDDPAGGSKRRFHYVTTLVGDDEYVLQMFDVDAEGNDHAAGAITFTRKKE